MRILVVEDEWMIADQIADVLRDVGYDVVGPVGRITEALSLLNGEQVDVALIDVNVHGDLTSKVAEALEAASVPFAFVSGYSRQDLPANLRGRPLLQKPVEANAVYRCVQSLLVKPA
jgi:two-component SAPR family response regulator